MKKTEVEKVFYKSIDLFGNEIIKFSEKKKKTKKNLFGDDYENFVNKFEVKKTTDDCYTPREVYQVVLDFVNKSYPIKDCEIIRPFYPGGKFDELEYPENAVVIDNPPFSIISKISKFYEERNIPYFLFAPHLTLFSIKSAKNYIVIGVNIVYENGAFVNTSFISNMFGDDKIIADADFYSSLKKLTTKKEVLKYRYPSNVITVSKLAKLTSRGVSFSIKDKDLISVSGMDDQKKYKKTIFGGGFFTSNEKAMEMEKIEKIKAIEAMEMEKIEKIKAIEEEIVWELSQRELNLIEKIGQ